MRPWNKGIKVDRKKYPKMGLFGHHSKETKLKMSISRKGKKLSVEHKKKISESLKGKKSYSWKDGRSNNNIYRSWLKNKRNRVLKRIKVKLGTHTFGDWENLKKQYNNICPCCHKSEPEIKLTEDHIIPLSKGGSDNIENIQPLCGSCNCKKHTKIIKY